MQWCFFSQKLKYKYSLYKSVMKPLLKAVAALGALVQGNSHNKEISYQSQESSAKEI